MNIPEPRGPTSKGLFALLSGTPGAVTGLHELAAGQFPAVEDIVENEDIQLSLFCLYEQH